MAIDVDDLLEGFSVEELETRHGFVEGETWLQMAEKALLLRLDVKRATLGCEGRGLIQYRNPVDSPHLVSHHLHIQIEEEVLTRECLCNLALLPKKLLCKVQVWLLHI